MFDLNSSLNATLSFLDEESKISVEKIKKLTPEEELLKIKKLTYQLKVDKSDYYNIDIRKVINGILYADGERKLFTTNSNILRAITARYFIGFTRDKNKLRTERDYTLNQIKKVSQCEKKDNYTINLVGGTVERNYLLDWIELNLQARLDSVNNLLKITTVDIHSRADGVSAWEIMVNKLMSLHQPNKYPVNIRKADKKDNLLRVKSKPRSCLNKKNTPNGIQTVMMKANEKLVFDSDYNITDKKYERLIERNVKIIKTKTPLYKSSLIPMFPDQAKEREKITQPITQPNRLKLPNRLKIPM